MIARNANPLNVVEHNQPSVERIGRLCDLRQVKRRTNKSEPVGEVFEGLHSTLDRPGVLSRKSSMPDQRPVNRGQPSTLAVELNRRAHCDVADERFEIRRERRRVDDQLHRQVGLALSPALRQAT